MFEEDRYHARQEKGVDSIDISAGPADKLVIAFDRDVEVMQVYIFPSTEAGAAFGAGGVAGRVSFDKLSSAGVRSERYFGTLTTGAGVVAIGTNQEMTTLAAATLLENDALIIEHETAQTAGTGSAAGIYNARVVYRELWDASNLHR